MKHVKYSKALPLTIMIITWFLLPTLGKDVLKRYFSSGIFISVVVLTVNFIAKKRKWWRWYEAFSPKITWVVPFTWGPFLIGSLFILKWTYGNFFRYMLLNILVDGLFTFGLEYYLKKFKIFSLVQMSKSHLMYVFTFDALLLYGFQFLKENILMDKV